jgi:iron complex outermembrane receptor protein
VVWVVGVVGVVWVGFGDSDTKPRNVLFNAQYQVGENTDLYAFGQFGRRDTEAAATWRSALVLVPGSQPPRYEPRTPLFPNGFLPLQNS